MPPWTVAGTLPAGPAACLATSVPDGCPARRARARARSRSRRGPAARIRSARDGENADRPGAEVDDSVRAAILVAAREFNAGRYFEAHEALEEALDEVPEDLWSLFLGLIQVAVGYHKSTQPRRPGAARMLESGLEKLAPHANDAAGIDLGALRARARHDLDLLRAGSFDAEEFARHPPRLRPLRARPRRRPGARPPRGPT